ncbi:serine/threonine protein kinase [Ectobacillus ponti]|uniref:non-specific serine/threonine protein kinase n=1 Tax=Ectobacillus ponti TaxID=2961894 RepID=A0AA41XAW7_9BACI|nr:serine/threonine-protein kinase [Ectobacillus ponti]MCP8970338.1 serine/threonine protein kinase [Ectobacillus ponti]
MRDWLQRIAALWDRPWNIGTLIGEKYRLERLLGAGSYGFAYAATDCISSQQVVIKQLRRSKQLQEAGRKSFQYEQNILRQLSHPSIPRFREAFVWQDSSCFVMDYIQGKTFEDLIFSEQAVFPEADAFLVVERILQIVRYIHAQGIVHRDLRIPNIILSGGELYIIDFGLARPAGDWEEREASFSGTKRYMRETQYRSDFYALGHFLLFLLYSGYEPKKREQPWYEELALSAAARHSIRRMLQMEAPYEHADEILADVQMIVKGREKACFKRY